jgi:hypothetical protein
MVDNERWTGVATRLGEAVGGPIVRLAEISRPRDDRRVSRGQVPFHQVIVKASTDAFAAERAVWASSAWPALAARGYPAPEMIWHRRLDER